MVIRYPLECALMSYCLRKLYQKTLKIPPLRYSVLRLLAFRNRTPDRWEAGFTQPRPYLIAPLSTLLFVSEGSPNGARPQSASAAATAARFFQVGRIRPVVRGALAHRRGIGGHGGSEENTVSRQVTLHFIKIWIWNITWMNLRISGTTAEVSDTANYRQSIGRPILHQLSVQVDSATGARHGSNTRKYIFSHY